MLEYRDFKCDDCSADFVRQSPKRGKDGKIRCPDCQKGRNNKIGKDSRPKYLKTTKNWFLKNNFGITIQDYERLRASQGDNCAICGHPETAHNKSLAVDHDHTTNRVRGLLCMNCNQLVGKAKDSVLVLQAAIDYLKKHGAT